MAGAPSNINPLDSGSELTRWIAEPVVESLYTYDDDAEVRPAAGRRRARDQPPTSSPGPSGCSTDVTFQNGDPLTADDVVATLDHMLDLSSGSEWITYLHRLRAAFEWSTPTP